MIIKFLFAAVGLQLARIVIVNELTKTEAAGSQNRNETKLHEFQEKTVEEILIQADPVHESRTMLLWNISSRKPEFLMMLRPD